LRLGISNYFSAKLYESITENQSNCRKGKMNESLRGNDF